MKALLNVVRTNPSSIEEIVIEDIDRILISDNQIGVLFNTGKEESIALRSNDGETTREWGGLSLFLTRIGLEIDMTK